MIRLTSKKSFTLVEVLIATVIVAIALCGILAAYVGCFEVLTTTKNVNIAINAIEGLMEDIRNTTFTLIANDQDIVDAMQHLNGNWWRV